MPDLPCLDGYDGQSTDELIALEGMYRTDSIVLAFEQAMDQKAARLGDGALSDEERIILVIEALEREVNNGGYELFFGNLSREYASTIVDDLREIGCPKTAEVTQKALRVVQEDPMTEEELTNFSWTENEGLHTALNDCDSLYFALGEDIAERLFAFIKSNRSRIEL